MLVGFACWGWWVITAVGLWVTLLLELVFKKTLLGAGGFLLLGLVDFYSWGLAGFNCWGLVGYYCCGLMGFYNWGW